MASYADAGLIADLTEFERRVRVALGNAASAVYSEDPSTQGHAARQTFAVRVANGNYNLEAMCFMVMSQAAITAEAVFATVPGNAIPDADIQFTVNSLWNVFAGA